MDETLLCLHIIGGSVGILVGLCLLAHAIIDLDAIDSQIEPGIRCSRHMTLPA